MKSLASADAPLADHGFGQTKESNRYVHIRIREDQRYSRTDGCKEAPIVIESMRQEIEAEYQRLLNVFKNTARDLETRPNQKQGEKLCQK